MEPFLNLIPAESLLHMTASYSNAVLLAVLTNVSDFSQKLDLPVQRPVTEAHVQSFFPHPIKDYVAGELTLTNGDRFSFHHGHVSSFRAHNNFLTGPADIKYEEQSRLEEWAADLYGPVNMSTNEVIAFAREALRSLGYDPKILHADRPPTQLRGPSVHEGKTIPFCRVEWRDEDVDDIVRFDVNVEEQQVVGFSIVSTNAWRPDPPLGVKPELESDYRKRTQGSMFIRTNAPSRPPKTTPSRSASPGELRQAPSPILEDGQSP